MTGSDQSNKAEVFSKGLGVLAATLGFQLTPVILEAYWRVIGPRLTIEEFQAACDKILATKTWFPKPVEIIEAVHGNTQDRAEGAWLALNRAIDDVGGYKSPRFTDKVLIATIESLGGWQYLCVMSTREFESFVRPKFLETYQSFLKTGTTSNRPLVGIHDQQNGRHGSKHVAALVGELGLEQKRITEVK